MASFHGNCVSPPLETGARGRRTGISQIRRCLVVLFRGYRVFRNTPAMTETICQFKYGQDELAFGCAALLEPSLESELFDFGGV